jgi:DNA ligase 1
MQSLSGQTIAITGALSRTREHYVGLIEQNGGTFAPSVTKKVTHLVAAEPDGASEKLTKARKMGIEVVGEDYLNRFEGNVERPALAPKPIVAAEPVVKKAKTTRAEKLKEHYPNFQPHCPGMGAPALVQQQIGTAGPHKLSGMVIALTGRLSKPKEEYGRIIAAHGGTLAGTVTKKTTHVVAREADGASDKLEKARKYGAQILSEDFLLNLGAPVAGGAPPVAASAPKKTVSKKARQVEGQEAPTQTKMASPPEVLLAQKYEPDKHGSMVGWWVSEKLDGVRAWWDGNQFWSRTGNLFYAPDWFRAQMPKNCILDGELFIGRKKFKETVSIVKSHSMSERWKELSYMVFDMPSEGKLPFEQRLEKINAMAAERPNSVNLKVVAQRPLTAQDDLVKMLADVEALGAEGLMLRQPGSQYIGKRSNTLLKMKTFTDDEAKVIGYATEGKGRLAGSTGSLMVEDRNGVRFDVGSGMDDDLRRNPPPIGSIITFRYQEKSESSGRPRFPVYVGLAIDKEFP